MVIISFISLTVMLPSNMKKLTEIRLAGNPSLESFDDDGTNYKFKTTIDTQKWIDNDSVISSLHESIASVCPALQHIDTSAIIAGGIIMYGKSQGKKDRGSINTGILRIY